MRKNRLKSAIPLLVIFLLFNGFILVARDMMVRWNMDRDVVMIGNLLLFVITFASFFMAVNGLKASNPHAFIRSIYTSMMLKLFVCAIAAFIYISMSNGAVNKPALFTCMGLYLVYTFVEVSVLTRMLKERTHE